MRGIKKILVPTDLSEDSGYGIRHACSLAADENAELVILHVANELEKSEFYPDEFAFAGPLQSWPLDRVLKEASLDLNHFLEQHVEAMGRVPSITKRVVLGPIPDRIVEIATGENIDLIVMSPKRQRGFRHLFARGITDRVTRMSPCPVLSVAPPLPSPLWRRKSLPSLFNWPRPKTTFPGILQGF
jgi:nucleotide-binding universal stress UspA family protein